MPLNFLSFLSLVYARGRHMIAAAQWSLAGDLTPPLVSKGWRQARSRGLDRKSNRRWIARMNLISRDRGNDRARFARVRSAVLAVRRWVRSHIVPQLRHWRLVARPGWLWVTTGAVPFRAASVFFPVLTAYTRSPPLAISNGRSWPV